jgi:outer membrane protein assembly factor BamB
MLIIRTCIAILPLLLVWARLAPAADWPMLGRTSARNAVSPEKDPPLFWQVATRDASGQLLQPAQNVKWTARLGSLTFGDPVISDGLVWVGTNNSGLDPDDKSDASVLLCFRASDGKRLYKYRSPRHEQGRIHDWEIASLACSPLIEGDRLWFTTNRCETVCLDIAPLQRGEGEPRVVWKVDMLGNLGVYPRSPVMGIVHLCSITAYGEWIYVITGNGTDNTYSRVPRPDAPSLVCFEKSSGKVVWQDNSPGENILDGQWGSPLAADIGGVGQVIAPFGDGWLRSFEPGTGKLLWEFDINFKESLWKLDRGTRLFLLAAPVLYGNRVYIGSGVHPEFGQRNGRLCCIDPTRRGDISSELALDAAGKPLPRRRLQAVDKSKSEQAVANPNSGLVWEFTRLGNGFEDHFHQTYSQVAIADDLVIAADGAGVVHCLDARTGQRHWHCDTLASCTSSPLIVDRTVYVANQDEVCVFRLSADPRQALRSEGNALLPIARTESSGFWPPAPIYSNRVLYVTAGQKLLAISSAPGPAAEVRAAERTGGAASPGFWPQFRGPRRDNISTEVDLLKEWPPEGPPLVWRVDGLGDGVAGAVVAYGRVYVIGRNAAAELLLALSEEDGSLVWAKATGPAASDNPLMRWLNHRTSVVEKDRVYVVHPLGKLTCFSTREGRERWSIDYAADLAGKRPHWGFGDTPLVDGERLVCAPGGPGAALVALDKRTGEVIWKGAAPGDPGAGYSETIVATFGGLKQYIRQFDTLLAGFSAADGKLLWSRERKGGYLHAASTPVAVGEALLVPDGSAGILLAKIETDGTAWSARELSQTRVSLDNFSDNTLVQDNAAVVFHAGVAAAQYDFRNGAALWKGSRLTVGKIATTFADGRIYARFSDGAVQLLELQKDGLALRGALSLSDHKPAMGAAFPVVAGGRLYLRDDDHLFCQDVSAGALGRPRAAPRSIVLSLPEDLGAAPRERVGTARAPEAIFVPTPGDVAARMLELAGVKKTDLVCDLGSGDGRVVIAAARSYGCRAVGYEIDPELVKQSREAVANDPKIAELVRIDHQDLFTADLGTADVVAVYLPPKLLERLLPQLARLKPGARVVSHHFKIPGVAPDKSEQFDSDDDNDRHTLHLWTAPLKVPEAEKK